MDGMMTLEQVALRGDESSAALGTLCLLAVVTAVVMLLVYRQISNQQEIRRVKDRIKAHLLELRLFKDEPVLVLKAQGHILLATLRYMKANLLPLAVLALPFVYLALVLDPFFAFEPLMPGDATVVAASFRDAATTAGAPVELTVPSGLAVETPPLRLSGRKEVDWRVRAVSEGTHELQIRVGETTFSKSITVGRALARVTPARERGAILSALLPGEQALPPQGALNAITVGYPARYFDLLGWRLHWLVVFLVTTIIAGFSLQGVFNVRL